MCSMQDAITVAQSYIAAGIKCIPIIKGEKKPHNRNWSTEFLTFEQFKSFSKPGDGLAIITGKCSGIICIDIDKKHGGLSWYENNKDTLGNHILEQTPGGGFHLYFRYPEQIDYVPSTSKLAQGVELMADGGRYVITAPSSHPNGGTYKLVSNIDLSQITWEIDPPPTQVLDTLFAITTKRNKALEDPTYITHEGLRGDMPRAIEAITNMPAAKEGEAGDTHTYAAACVCRDYGLTQMECYQVLKVYFNPRCVPPWSDNDLRTKILNGYKYAKDPIGNKIPPPLPESTKALQASKWLATTPQPITPIMIGVLDAGDKMVIIGQSKTRKSFFAEQLAIITACGGNFLGFDIPNKKKVLLIQLEIRQNQYHWRCVKMCKALEIEPHELENLWVVNARGSAQIPQLLEDRIDELKPEVIIIDPFYKVITGDENKAEDVKLILRSFDALAEKTGAAIVYVHHDKKGISGDHQLTDRGAGSGVLARDFDSAIFLSPHKEGNNDLVMEFITRNYPPKPSVTIAWDNYRFILSDALPTKKTTRSASQEPKVKLNQLTILARKVIEDALDKGYTQVGAASLRAMLEDGGVGRNKLSAVKEELVRDGVIEITSVQKDGRYGGKMVTLHRSKENTQTSFYSRGVSEDLDI